LWTSSLAAVSERRIEVLPSRAWSVWLQGTEAELAALPILYVLGSLGGSFPWQLVSLSRFFFTMAGRGSQRVAMRIDVSEVTSKDVSMMNARDTNALLPGKCSASGKRVTDFPECVGWLEAW